MHNRLLTALPLLLTACSDSAAFDPLATASVSPVEARPLLETDTGADAVGMGVVGRWHSTQDRLSEVVIDFGANGHRLISLYDGEQEPGEAMTFVTDCEARVAAAASSRTFTVGEGADATCFTLDTLNEEEMVLTALPHGSRETFRRSG